MKVQMKVLRAIFFCLLLTPTALGGDTPARLPESVKSVLDRRFPGWRFSEVSGEVQQFLRERHPGALPNLIKGDFDGNGQTDYAVLIEHGNFDRRGKAFGRVVELLAFLRRGSGYKLFTLERTSPANPELYLTLAGKGAEGHDFHAGRNFRYPNDSIGFDFFGKAGGTYIYRRGKFRYVYKSD